MKNVLRLAAGVLVAVFLASPVSAADKSASFHSALDSITAEELGNTVHYLADPKLEGREAGTHGGFAAGDYLAGQLGKLHLQAGGANRGYFQPFPPNFRNILAVVPGSDPELKDRVVVVGAHYDHLGHGVVGNQRSPPGPIYPGADDNASGASGVLQTARAFALLGQAPRRTVLFAFWDGEEKGLLGTKYWTANPTIPLDHVATVLNADMIGTLRDNRLTIFGSRTSQGFRRFASEQNRDTNLVIDFSWLMRADADHITFWNRGIPVLFLHTGLHDRYHRPTDVADQINQAGLQRVAQFLFTLTYELADATAAPHFRAVSRVENEDLRRRFAQADPSPVQPGDPPLRLGITWRRDEAEPAAIYVTHVVVGSPAAAAGLQVGDRIYQIGGRNMPGDEAFVELARTLPDPIELVVERDGQLHVMQIRFSAAHGKVKRAA